MEKAKDVDMTIKISAKAVSELNEIVGVIRQKNEGLDDQSDADVIKEIMKQLVHGYIRQNIPL